VFARQRVPYETSAIALQADGRILVGGLFRGARLTTSFNGLPMLNLLHFSRRAIAALFLVAASAAQAVTFTVTTTASNGPGSLEEAVANCNLYPNTGMIVFDLPGSGPHTIDLTGPLPFFNKDMQIINDNPGDGPPDPRHQYAFPHLLH
jgi:hypothetical protein